MGPIGMQEMVMIFIIILLLFGAKKLPELARGIGKSMGEFKKAKEEFEHEITRAEIGEICYISLMRNGREISGFVPWNPKRRDTPGWVTDENGCDVWQCPTCC